MNEERITATCRTFKGDANWAGYKYGVFHFIFGMRCSDIIFYGDKKKGFHLHLLVKIILNKTEIEEGKNEVMK